MAIFAAIRRALSFVSNLAADTGSSLHRKAVHLESSGAVFDVSPVTGEMGAATGNSNPLRIGASISPAASGRVAVFPENATPLRRIERDRYVEAARQ